MHSFCYEASFRTSKYQAILEFDLRSAEISAPIFKSDAEVSIIYRFLMHSNYGV